MSDARKQQLRGEYVARINRVIDHIEAHLADDLRLDELARVASFSRFHFHRLFGALVGETLNQFIQRLRVEKAASLLVANPQVAITDIALDCGFSSSATFARTFRDAFGMSASEWRAGGHHELRKIRKLNRNVGKTVGNASKACAVSICQIDAVTQQPTWRIEMKTKQGKKIEGEVEIKELPELHVAYVRHVGPYAGQSEVFERIFGKLMAWATPRGLCRFPGTQVLSVYHDDPNVTEEEKLRVSACITVPEDTEVTGEIGKMTVPGGKFAVGHFELGADEYSDAWNMLMGGWLPESGYQPDDRLCYEHCLTDPKQHPEGKVRVDICVPVKPL